MFSKKRNSILKLNYEFPPLGGGAANANYHLIKEFSKEKNIQIDLVTTSTNKFKVEKFSKNINIHYLDIGKDKKLHLQSQKDLLLYSWKAYIYARKLIKKNKYDIIHAWFGIPCGFLAMLLKLEYGIKYVVGLRGSDVPFYNKRFFWLDTFCFQHLSKLIWKFSSCNITNSKRLARLARKTMKTKFKIIYNGVDTEFFKPLKTTKKKRNKIKLISTGRLIQRKGYHILLSALKNHTQKYSLTLIGGGDQEKMLKNLARKYNIECNFLGMQTKDIVRDELQKADIFVLPSLNEGMSNSILEAMACGLPIIATNVGGSDELINGNGWIVKKNNVEELQKILKIIKKSSLNKMVYASLKRSKEFSWKKMAEQYLEVYV